MRVTGVATIPMMDMGFQNKQKRQQQQKKREQKSFADILSAKIQEVRK